MAWPTIDATKPAGSDKKKFGDDEIRASKQHVVDCMGQISNFSNAGDAPALRTAVWTTATRPSGANLVDRVTGYNTDLGHEEYYDLATTSWKAKGGIPGWTCSTRPASPFVGQYGFNSELWVTERWSGSAWQRISGGQRGDICMWSGSVADIATKKVGWVLADGTSHTIDGATFSVPDLRDRFIVGAGQDGGTYAPGTNGIGTGYYAPGATGGEDKHSMTETENGPHNHYATAFLENTGGGNYRGTSFSGNNTTIYTSTSGSGTAHENRPPYYALCFLYKI